MEEFKIGDTVWTWTFDKEYGECQTTKWNITNVTYDGCQHYYELEKDGGKETNCLPGCMLSATEYEALLACYEEQENILEMLLDGIRQELSNISGKRKYIRDGNEIIDTDLLELKKDGKRYCDKDGFYWEPTAESDHIEDLFDAFVAKTDKGYIQLSCLAEADRHRDIKTLYGAIWTDTGLAFVAEQKEGRWQLI